MKLSLEAVLNQLFDKQVTNSQYRSLPVKTLVRKGLVVAALGAALLSFSSDVHAQQGLLRQVYTNVFGGVDGLLLSPDFPGNPSFTELIPEFRAASGTGTDYGQKISGYIVPPQTGEYTFWLASDDEGRLFLSQDENPENRQQIATVLTWVSPGQWELESGQRSQPIPLEAGKPYYIEALMTQGGGADFLEVRWQLPDGTIEEPIPTVRLFVELIPPQIAAHPRNVSAVENSNAIFNVQFGNIAPVAMQWLRNDVPIPGATNRSLVLTNVQLSDAGTRYHVQATNFFSTNTLVSSFGILEVSADVTPPGVVSAQTGAESGLVTLTFSEALDPVSAAIPTNYELMGGGQVLRASVTADGKVVVLRTTPLQAGAPYTLLLQNLRDRARNPNLIDPGLAVDFSFGHQALPACFVHGRSEKPGPSTRRTGLVISEIMYHPAPRSDSRNIEFIELYNSQAFLESLGGYRITGSVDYTFPNGTFIAAGEHLVVAAVPDDLQALIGPSKIVGPFTNSLPDAGTIRLENDQGAVLLEIEYDSRDPWPVAPDGAGPSLVLARPSYGEGDPQAWAASELTGGSPGRAEAVAQDQYEGLVINEFLANTDPPQLDYLELFNYSNAEIDLSGMYLSDDIATNKYRVPAGTRISPLGFVSFNESQLGFALNSSGEKILLRSSDGSRIVDAVAFGPQRIGLPDGRYPDGNGKFRALSAASPGVANQPPRQPEVIITEIMYNPASKNPDDEYIELYNRSGQPLNLRGWRLQEGVSFTFTEDFSLAAGAYLVIAKDIARLRANHPSLHAGNSIGNFNGNLANDGERVVLRRPDSASSMDDEGRVVTNLFLVDEVTYDTGGRWPRWADGGGSSIELVDLKADNDDPANWADSDESGKSEWVTIERRGILNWGATNFVPTVHDLHILLADFGEALVDNVQVFRDGGPNLFEYQDFNIPLRYWRPGGTHEDSTIEPSEGREGGPALHLRAEGRGDTSANKVRVPLTGSLTNGEIATIRADVRWLRGTPEILLRLHGNYLELEGVMPLPKNLGTPAAPNSRQVPNAPPSIQNVEHTPALPAQGQAVTVLAELKDADAVALAILNYRVDPTNEYSRVPMSYRGAGFFSAELPGQRAGAALAFYIEAMDGQGAAARFPADAPRREGVIVFGDTSRAGDFGTYHLWLTQTNLNRWRLREQSSNKQIDATFVYNDDRIIYNMGTLYSGSVFHWRNYNGPLGNLANYIMVMPEDDQFLGQTDFILNLPSNIGSDNTGIREQVVFWMADQVDQPFNHRRYHHLSINAIPRGTQSIWEDAQQPSRDFIEQWYPDAPDGALHKIEDWFEFGPNSFFNLDGELTALYTTNLTTGERELKKERYRWWFKRRAVRESAHDYSELLQLVEAVNQADEEEFIARTRALIDIDEWMGAIAFRHAVGDWDAYGHTRGKNMYAYKPPGGKWQLLHWDIAFALGLGDGPFHDLFDVSHFDGSEDLITKRMMETPEFRRSYLRMLERMANGPMVASRVNSVIDARFAGLVENGIPLVPPAQVKTWIAQRREYILGQLGTYTAGFGLTSHSQTAFSTNRNTLVLTGTAPINVHSIRINDEEYPIEWTGLTTWRTRVALRPRQSNVVTVTGVDENGEPIPGASATLNVNVTGTVENVADRVVINEILADPLQPRTEFVELHNTSRLSSFDLSGYRLNGVGFTFPSGSVIPPGGFLLVVRDPVAFGERFGYTIPIAGTFTAAVDNEGELISLVQPASEGGEEVAISSVRFDDLAPWPAAVEGASWQLIDPVQDASRVGNWAVVPGDATPANTNSVRGTLTSPFPLVWLNEVQAANANGPADGAGDRDPWVELYNSGAESISLSGLFLTDDPNDLRKWAFPTAASLAAGQRMVVWLDGEPGESTATELHTGFRLNTATGVIALAGTQRNLPSVFDYLRFESLPAGQSYGAFPEGQASRRELFRRPTPGAINDLSAGPANVWINEWMASNSTTIADPDDLDFDDWIELYNAGSQPADLSGYSITDNPANQAKYVFPQGTVIPAHGFLLLWADEERATNGQVHLNFRLSADGEVIALFAPDGTQVDRVDFGPQVRDQSQGRSPDGGAIAIQGRPSPGVSNAGVDPNALRFRSAVVTQGRLVLRWNSAPGAVYRVESTGSLTAPVWTQLGTVTATAAESSIEDALGGSPRFYRVLRQ